MIGRGGCDSLAEKDHRGFCCRSVPQTTAKHRDVAEVDYSAPARGNVVVVVVVGAASFAEACPEGVVGAAQFLEAAVGFAVVAAAPTQEFGHCCQYCMPFCFLLMHCLTPLSPLFLFATTHCGCPLKKKGVETKKQRVVLVLPLLACEVPSRRAFAAKDGT